MLAVGCLVFGRRAACPLDCGRSKKKLAATAANGFRLILSPHNLT